MSKDKIEHKEHFHGSDLEKIEKIYGIKKEDITSFSANVNPLGISYKLKKELASHIDAITSYPDREYTSLRKCIAEYCHTDYENIIVGNGSTELISLFIQIFYFNLLTSKIFIYKLVFTFIFQNVFQSQFQCFFLWELIGFVFTSDRHTEYTLTILRNTIVFSVQHFPVVCVPHIFQSS